MFVRQLIGREANTIINLPFDAATSCLAMGTVATVTDEEITAAGLAVEDPWTGNRPDEMPPGYRAEPSEGGGFDVLDAGGVTINKEFIPNLAAARSFAHDLLTPFMPLPDAPGTTDDLSKLTKADLLVRATAAGIDTTGLSTNAKIIAALTEKAAADKDAADAAAQQAVADAAAKAAVDAQTKADADAAALAAAGGSQS